MREDHPRARPQRFQVRPAAQARADQRLHRGRRDQRERRALRQAAPLRGEAEGGGGVEGEGPVGWQEVPHDAPGSLLEVEGHHRTLPEAAVVDELQGSGRQERVGPARGRAEDRAGVPPPDVVPLAGEHPGLVYLPAAVVGAPHPRLPRDQARAADGDVVHWPNNGGGQAEGSGEAGGEGRGARAGRGRPRHLVLLRPLPLLRLRLAGHRGF
mmetsp:Transcript_91177/g.266916  ORF Transcript_91177/g.266916 Transcript_91177/m.266916 type:complete len:212 (-) Transcript_91177:1504-2139(-)